jgi:hypothetical protein
VLREPKPAHRGDGRDCQDNLDDKAAPIFTPQADFATLVPARFSTSSAEALSRRSGWPSRCSKRHSVADLQHHRIRQMRLLPNADVSSLQRAASGFSATGSTGPSRVPSQSPRGDQPGSRPRRPRRRSVRDAGQHSGDRLRMRRSQRQNSYHRVGRNRWLAIAVEKLWVTAARPSGITPIC